MTGVCNYAPLKNRPAHMVHAYYAVLDTHQLWVFMTSVCPHMCRQMVDVAEAEERVILTCDRTFIRMGYSDQAFYVRTTNKQEQVREVLAHFSITIKEDSLLSRCAKCNGTFFPRYLLTSCVYVTRKWCLIPSWLHQIVHGRHSFCLPGKKSKASEGFSSCKLGWPSEAGFDVCCACVFTR